MAKIGIIGGSGLDDKLNLTDINRTKVHTPYGATSDLLISGRIKDVDVVAIARHGANHRIMPSLVNYRANIRALKENGVTHIISTTACGSLREEIKPGHIIFIDQFIDRTTKRAQTFYEGMHVCHIPMADPFCPKLRKLFSETAVRLKIPHHDKGTMVTIEGPRFSTKAESNMFRMLGGDLVNMSTVPEVVLAREAGICYAQIAMCTDYDCWHETEEKVSVEVILHTMEVNAANVNRMLQEVVPQVSDWDCECTKAYQSALL